MNPLFFSQNKRQLYGTYFEASRPSKDGSRHVALYCNPLGQEYLRTHWASRQLAERLGRKGISFFKFDYSGTGDSEGLPVESSLDNWVEDIKEAYFHLTKEKGFQNVSLIGLRFGALLAIKALEKFPAIAIKNLILWDPIVSGRDYLNGLKELHQEILVSAPDRIPYPKGEDYGPSQQFLGYAYPIELLEKMKETKLETIKGNYKKVCLVQGDQSEKLEKWGREIKEKSQDFLYYQVDSPGYWENYEELQEQVFPIEAMAQVEKGLMQ